MAITTNLAIGDLSPDAVFQILQNQGLSASQATAFVGSWLVSSIGLGKRTFNYVQDFPEIDPDAVSKFVRGFAHQDWQDGVSVVQASETPDELGFNNRFHLIEKDLDSIAANLALAFTTLATMRQQVFNMLQEVKAELNRIDADLDGRRTAPPPPVSGPFTQGTFLGFTTVNEVPMQLWQTGAGMMMLPNVAVLQGEAWTNPRASRAGQLARFIADHPDVNQAFPQAVEVQAFLNAFGDRPLPDGTFARALVGSLPVSAKFPNLAAMVTDVSDREAAALRTTEGARQAIAVSLGVSGPDSTIENAKLDRFGSLAPAARAALLKNGIDTVGKFSKLPPEKAAEILRKEGVTTVTDSDLKEAGGIAITLAKLG